MFVFKMKKRSESDFLQIVFSSSVNDSFSYIAISVSNILPCCIVCVLILCRVSFFTYPVSYFPYCPYSGFGSGSCLDWSNGQFFEERVLFFCFCLSVPIVSHTSSMQVSILSPVCLL